jgi:hypothetical protein
MGMRPSIDVHIEELVLTGFPRGAGRDIGEAVQRRLAHLFTERGVPAGMQQSIAAPRVDAGSFAVGTGVKPAAIGGQIAHAVYRVSRP